MNLKETAAQIVREEMGDCIEGIRFTGPYEGEEFNIVITLRCEPQDIEEREVRLHDRVWELGYDVGLFVEYPEQTVAV